MHKIEAVISPDRLTEVLRALTEQGIADVSVAEAESAASAGEDQVRLEFLVDDHLAMAAFDVLIHAAGSGDFSRIPLD